MLTDARIPVRFCNAVPPACRDEALILAAPMADRLTRDAGEGGWCLVRRLPAGGVLGCHPPGCRCGAGRPAAAMLLAALFQARARGEVGWFRAITVATLDAAPLRLLLARDAFLRGCFVAASRGS